MKSNVSNFPTFPKTQEPTTVEPGRNERLPASKSTGMGAKRIEASSIHRVCTRRLAMRIDPSAIRTNPDFDGTIGTTSTQPNPELMPAIADAAQKAVEAERPGATIKQIELTSSIEFQNDCGKMEKAHPTSERALYNYFNHIYAELHVETRSGQKEVLKGAFSLDQGRFMMGLEV